MVDINITGGAYQSSSQATNWQRCVNWYPIEPGPDGRGRATLKRRAGKRELTDLTGTRIRGMIGIPESDKLYVVCDDKFYRVVIDGTAMTAVATQKGTLNNSQGEVHMRSNATQILIMNGTTTGYIFTPLTKAQVTRGTIGGTGGDTYNLTINGTAIYTAQNVAVALTDAALVAQINTLTGTTGVTALTVSAGVIRLTNDDDGDITVVESGTGFTAGTDGLTKTGEQLATGTRTAFNAITDADFLGGSVCEHMDGYFIYAPTSSQNFYFSALQDGFTYDSADVATAEYRNDNIVAFATKKRHLWIFGSKSVETWYDAANASGSPFSSRVGTELNVGCAAPRSIVEINNTLFWLDSRKYIVMAQVSDDVTNNTSGNATGIISTEAINASIAGYSTVSDAIAVTFVERGHMMYQITFPTADKTWVYDLATQAWHERSHYNAVSGEQEADLTQYAVEVDGITVVAGYNTTKLYMNDATYMYDDDLVITLLRTSSHLSQEFKIAGIERLELRFDTGTVDQGVTPEVMLRYSGDSGHTWSSELSRDLGAVGQYDKRVEWNRLGSLRQWIFEVKITDPIDAALVEGIADVTEIEEY